MLWIPSAITLLSATNTCRSLIWWHSESRLQSRAARDCKRAREASADCCSQRRICSPAFCQSTQKQPGDTQTKILVRSSSNQSNSRYQWRSAVVVMCGWGGSWDLSSSSVADTDALCSLNTQWSKVFCFFLFFFLCVGDKHFQWSLRSDQRYFGFLES